VDKDMRLISTSIISKSYEINESSDACLINVILNLHMSMSRLVNSKYYTHDEYILHAILRTFSNYFYSAVVSDTDRNLTIPELVKYSEMLHKVTTLGMFKEVTDIINKKNAK
jgi:hypothetical protein